MKLNYRDRIVLTILIVILVWVAGVMLFIKPAIERVQDSQAALDSAKATRSDLRDRVEADKDLPERIEAAYKEVNTLTDSFYDIQETQIASQQIDDLLKTDEIENLNLKLSDYTIYQLKPFVYVDSTVVSDPDQIVEDYMSQGVTITPETAPAEGEAVAAPASIGSYQISFNFEGKVENVQKFCDHMKNTNDQKTMTISQIDYKFDTETKSEGEEKVEEQSEEDVSGSMTLTMMVVQKLPEPKTLAVSED